MLNQEKKELKNGRKYLWPFCLPSCCPLTSLPASLEEVVAQVPIVGLWPLVPDLIPKSPHMSVLTCLGAPWRTDARWLSGFTFFWTLGQKKSGYCFKTLQGELITHGRLGEDYSTDIPEVSQEEDCGTFFVKLERMKVIGCAGHTRKPGTCSGQDVCSGKNWEDPKLSPWAYKQKLKCLSARHQPTRIAEGTPSGWNGKHQA